MPRRKQQQQPPQNETNRRIDELTSSVEELRRQMTIVQNEVQNMTELFQQSYRERIEIDSSSSVQDLRCQVSDMKNGMLRQKAHHKYEKSQWESERKRMKSQLEQQQQNIGHVPFWLYQNDAMVKGAKNQPRAKLPNNGKTQTKVSRFRALLRRIFSSNADSRDSTTVWPM